MMALPAGVAHLHELARSTDVLVAGYRPGVAERLGADCSTLAALNPALVYCAITGFGPRGPYRRYKGYEGLVAAKSGRMLTFAGQISRPGPSDAALQAGTHVAAQAAVQGIVAALLVREQTGRGQDVALLWDRVDDGVPCAIVMSLFEAVYVDV